MSGPLILEKPPPPADEKCCRRTSVPPKDAALCRGGITLTPRNVRFPIFSTQFPEKSGACWAPLLLMSTAPSRRHRHEHPRVPKRANATDCSREQLLFDMACRCHFQRTTTEYSGSTLDSSRSIIAQFLRSLQRSLGPDNLHLARCDLSGRFGTMLSSGQGV
jgi:hypothetical protein